MSDQLPAKEDSKRSVKPEEVPSTISNDALIVFHKKYHFPGDLVVRLSSKLERITLPPAGFFRVYEMSLQAGVRFPLPPELITILLACGINLSQLSYRAITIIMGLILFFRERKSLLTPEILSRLCRLISDSQGRISCRSKTLDLRVKDPPKNWSGRFFFVQNEWNIRERWGKLKDLPSPLQVGDEDVLRLLGLSSFDDFQYEVRFLSKILDEERLFKAGLSFHVGRSEAATLKKSSKVVPSPTKKATVKIPLPSRPEDHRSPAKRKSVAQPAVGRGSSVVDLSPESSKSRIPEHILKRSCLGMTRANDLATRRANLELEMTDITKEWNAEFVRIKYWLGEYKRRYQDKKKETADLEHQLSGCRAELAALLSSFSAQGQEVVRVRDEATEAQLQADNMKKSFKTLEAKVRALEKEAEAGSRSVEDFKNSMEFKMIIEEHVQKERDQILDVEVKNLERQCYEEGFIRGFLKATRVVNRQTGADIEGISPSQASEDLSSNAGDEAESVAESEDVDVERL